MWLTSTLRGNIKAELEVEVLNEGVHSGDASGIVPDSFRVLRDVLERLENGVTGEIHEMFSVDIPPHRYQENFEVAKKLGKEVYSNFPYINEN